MKHFVITIMDNPRSVEVAQRCIDTGVDNGMHIEMWPATTPKDNLADLMNIEGIGTTGFEEKWSRQPQCMAAFMSHYRLWKHSVELNQEVTIFEHDAWIVAPIPDNIDYRGCISFGQPSYGKWNDPLRFGVNVLTSKRYFPGAHAYRVKPHAAQKLIDEAKRYARPTDVFLHIDRFPFLEEYYPWPVLARDSFTTIQNENGIRAKHSYVEIGSEYKII